MSDKSAALQQIKKIIDDDRTATVNGKDYKISNPPFMKARSVFSYLSTIQHKLPKNDFGFLDDEKFKEIDKIIGDYVLAGGAQVGKHDYWSKEENMPDYITVTLLAMQVISYPFLSGAS